MAQPEIPGFYFDPEKKKYFKVQRAQHLPRPDCKYSQANVAKEKKKESEQKTAANHRKKHRQETIIRSYTSNFLPQATFDREIGHRHGSSYVHASWPGALASGFRSQTIVSNTPIRYFDRDPHSKTLYVVNGEASIQRRRSDPLTPLSIASDADDDFSVLANAYTFEPWDPLAQMTSPVSSLNYLPASGALCVTTYGSDRSPSVYITDPDRDEPFLGEMFTPWECSTIWSSAPRPLSFSSLPSTNIIPAAAIEHIAIGASSGLMMLTRANSGSWESSMPLNLASDIFALEWLSENTLALGCRNGKIHIYDTRAKGSSQVLKHAFPISRLRRADGFTRLVCSGLENTCVLYDMRMARPQSQHRTQVYMSSNPPNRNEREHQHNRKRDQNRKRKRGGNFSSISSSHIEPPSQPLLCFQHDNADDLELGLDVHPRLGLVAAAQADTRIRISNVWTGKLLKEFEAREEDTMFGGKKKVGRIRCLRFMDDDGDGDVSLWGSWDGGVRRFGW